MTDTDTCIAEIGKLLKEKKLYIFDFDGVLADSVEIKTEAFFEMYVCHGEEVASRVVSHHRKNGGMPRNEKFRFYHQEYLGIELLESELEAMSSEFSSLVNRRVIESNEIPGAENFLKATCKQDNICCINSATPQEDMRMIIGERGWSRYFSEILGSPCTKGGNISNLMNMFGARKKDCLFFGDSHTDLDAAKKASIDFIGIGKNMLYVSVESGDFPALLNFSALAK